MSDLVERLREGAKSPAKFDDTGWTAATCGIVSESADRIEHLERVLAQARDDADYLVHCSDSIMRDGDEARDVCRKLVIAIDEALK